MNSRLVRDYYNAGAEEEKTLARNRSAFDRYAHFFGGGGGFNFKGLKITVFQLFDSTALLP